MVGRRKTPHGGRRDGGLDIITPNTPKIGASYSSPWHDETYLALRKTVELYGFLHPVARVNNNIRLITREHGQTRWNVCVVALKI